MAFKSKVSSNNLKGIALTKKQKGKSKIKSCCIRLKRNLRCYKTTILLGIGLILFPIIVGLFYRIPISFVEIEIGDLLSFYAVALGLFATYLTYRESEDQKSLARQESLRPKIELILELDDDEIETNVQINNPTDNDYIVSYFGHEYYEDENRRHLNSKCQCKFDLDSWDENYPQLVLVGLTDMDKNEWMVAFEFQEGSHKYCRTSIDPQ